MEIQSQQLNSIILVSYVLILVAIGNSIVMGNITIDSLDDLAVFNPFDTCTNACTPSLYDLQDKNDDWDPFYCINNKIIIISSCPDTGRTCLVFDESKIMILHKWLQNHPKLLLPV